MRDLYLSKGRSLGASYSKTYDYRKLAWIGEFLEKLGMAVEELKKRGEGASVRTKRRKSYNR